MKISVMLLCFAQALETGRYSLADAFACCAEAGAVGIETMDSMIAEVSDEELKGLLTKYGLLAAAHDVSVELVREDAAGRRRAIDDLARELRRAGHMGAPIVMLVPGFLEPEQDWGQAFAHAVEGIREVLPLAAQLGVTVTAEQMGSTALCSNAQQLRKLAEAVNSPQFALCFDTGNAMRTQEGPLETLPALLPLVRHVHAKDHTVTAEGRRKDVPLGRGRVPLAEIYRLLEAGGYQGYLSVEHMLPADDPLPDLRTCISYLRPLIGN